MATFGSYSGWAKKVVFSGSLNTRPNVLGATLDGLSVVSVRRAPEPPASYPRCSTGRAACAVGANENASATAASISAQRKKSSVFAFIAQLGSESPDLRAPMVASPASSYRAVLLARVPAQTRGTSYAV